MLITFCLRLRIFLTASEIDILLLPVHFVLD